jgi:hypothetical protein
MKKNIVKIFIIGIVLSTTVLSVSVNARITYNICHECGQQTMWSLCGNDPEPESFTSPCSKTSGCITRYYTCSTREYCRNCGDVSGYTSRHDEYISHTICSDVQICRLP